MIQPSYTRLSYKLFSVTKNTSHNVSHITHMAIKTPTNKYNNKKTNDAIILRSAFIDTRAIDGHKNRTIIFVEANRKVREKNLICGCGVDGVQSKDYKVVPLYFSWITYNFPKLTHEELMIVCYDVTVDGNSMAFVRYRSSVKSISEATITVTHTKRRREADYKNKVVVCTICFGKPHFLKEWLLYHKTLRVDLVHMYVDESFMSHDANLQIIESYVNEGLLRIEKRQTYFNGTQIYYHSQMLNYHDCLYRFQEVYEFAFFLDVDDFFVPRLANKTLGYYLDRLFVKDRAEVRFWWLKFFPDCGYTQSLSSLKDGNITDVLAYREKVNVQNIKFVCRPMLTTLIAVHSALNTQPHTTSVYGDFSKGYVAHVTMNSLGNIPDKSKCEKIAKSSWHS